MPESRFSERIAAGLVMAVISASNRQGTEEGKRKRTDPNISTNAVQDAQNLIRGIMKRIPGQHACRVQDVKASGG
jgi:hypothetical protein